MSVSRFIANTVFAEIFVVVLILDVTFITKFKKLNNWRCTAACWACLALPKLKQHENLKNEWKISGNTVFIATSAYKNKKFTSQ